MDPEIDDSGMECDQEEGVSLSSSSSDVEEMREGGANQEGERESPPISVEVDSPSPEPAVCNISTHTLYVLFYYYIIYTHCTNVLFYYYIYTGCSAEANTASEN